MHSLVKPQEGKTQLLEGGCTSVLMCVCVGGGVWVALLVV